MFDCFLVLGLNKMDGPVKDVENCGLSFRDWFGSCGKVIVSCEMFVLISLVYGMLWN